MNFVDQITRLAKFKPDALAMVDRRRTLTYRDFYMAIPTAEDALLEFGLKEGDRIGLSFRNDMSHLVLILAAGRIGVATLTLDSRSSSQEIALYCYIADLTAIASDHAVRAEDGMPVIKFDSTLLDRPSRPADFGPARAQGGDLLFLINLSSGTTGRPNPAYATHRDYSHSRCTTIAAFSQPIGRRFLCMTSFTFTATRNLCLFELLAGSVLHFYPPLFSPQELVAEIHRQNINSAFMVPTVIRWLLTSEAPADQPLFPDFKFLIIGGAMMSGREKRLAAKRITPNIYEFYGTSVVSNMSILLPHELDEKADSVGRPGLLAETEVVDDCGLPLPAGQVGRVRCAAPRWPANPGIELDTPADQPQPPRNMAWYYPGEIGCFDDDGYLYLKSRDTDFIIRAGVNVYPGEIEDALMSHDVVVEAAVVGRPDKVLGESVVAFLTTAAPISPDVLRQHCRERLVAYKQPEEFIFVETLPKTAGGKVRKHILKKRWS
jgi:acyl-coenzyme A synthetase/AMP-(fatty) acid ligase